MALLSERSLTGAARRCGVHEKTLRRWMAEDESFRQAYTEARTAMFEAGMHRVQALAGRRGQEHDQTLAAPRRLAAAGDAGRSQDD